MRTFKALLLVLLVSMVFCSLSFSQSIPQTDTLVTTATKIMKSLKAQYPDAQFLMMRDGEWVILYMWFLDRYSRSIMPNNPPDLKIAVSAMDVLR